MNTPTFRPRLAGLAYLLDTLNIKGMPHWHTSYVALTGSHKSQIVSDGIEDIYSPQYWPGDGMGEHLEFALKYDGVNFGFLSQIFEKIDQEELVTYIASKPTGKYVRRIWFFYEFLTRKRLPLDDLPPCNYINALEEEKYFTIEKGKKSPRHRINNNLLGSHTFCPIVRKTEKLSKIDSSILSTKIDDIVSTYPQELFQRSLNYLYNKETKSSFEIEHIKPHASRTQKFVSALKKAQDEDFVEKEMLINLQNLIVDSRFSESDYRVSQNYVGETVSYQNEIIHFITPKPEDLVQLMEGLMIAHSIMKKGNTPVLIHAAVISYGFVFLHPFEDGNGRIHRFLIHNILNLGLMVPKGLMFPVSAVMLKNMVDYDASLETFSSPLLSCIDYQLDEMGKMRVENDTALYYKYMDMTSQAEALYGFVTKTVEEELIKELNFLVSYDRSKKAIDEIIDMPDRLTDLFIRLCVQHHGHLSKNKKTTHFDFLTDAELAAMEKAVQEAYSST